MIIIKFFAVTVHPVFERFAVYIVSVYVHMGISRNLHRTTVYFTVNFKISVFHGNSECFTRIYRHFYFMANHPYVCSISSGII